MAYRCGPSSHKGPTPHVAGDVACEARLVQWREPAAAPPIASRGLGKPGA